MFRQRKPNDFDLLPISPTHPPSATNTTLRLGPPQRLKSAWRLLGMRQGPPVIIPEAHQPLWYEKGWRRAANGKEYTGHYAAAGRSWRGRILVPYAKGYTGYIWHPPKPQIQRHTSHGPCFVPDGESGRYQILFHSMPSSLDHVIASIEEVLTQAVHGSTS